MSKVAVYKGKDGVWYARAFIGTNKVTGAKIRPYRKLPDAGSEDEARAMAEEWYASELALFAETGTGHKLSDLLNAYVDGKETLGQRRNTVREWRSFIRCYIDPYIGDRRADEITAGDLNDLYKSLQDTGGRGGDGISLPTVGALNGFLASAFQWMLGVKAVSYNPAAKLSRALNSNCKSRRPEVMSLDEGDVAALREFLSLIMSDPSHEPRYARQRETAMAVLIALDTGARCGEVLGLRRRDFDAETPSLTIDGKVEEADGPAVRKRELKAESSRRTVRIPADTARAISAHLAWQDETWPGGRKGDFPICGGRSGFIRPSSVSKRFKKWAVALDLPEWTKFHTLRHTHASLLAAHGEHHKAIQERLGHSRASMTVDTYTHAIPTRPSSAADTWGKIGRDAS